MTTRIELKGMEEISAAFASLPAQIEQAAKRTKSKGARLAGTLVRRDLAAGLGIPQKVLSAGKRIQLRLNSGLVWIGYNPIDVIYLGNARQTNSGVRVGSRFYPKAFVAMMPTGHIGVFRRVGKSRLPIQEVTQPIDQAPAVVEGIVDRVAERLPVIFEQELNYQTNVVGK